MEADQGDPGAAVLPETSPRSLVEKVLVSRMGRVPMAVINMSFGGLLLAAVILPGPGCVVAQPSPDISDTVSARDRYSEAEFEAELERIKKRTGTQRYRDWGWGQGE